MNRLTHNQIANNPIAYAPLANDRAPRVGVRNDSVGSIIARRCKKRRGMSSLEVVMTTALVFPIFATTAYVGIRALRVLYTVIGSMVGSPLL